MYSFTFSLSQYVITKFGIRLPIGNDAPLPQGKPEQFKNCKRYNRSDYYNRAPEDGRKPRIILKRSAIDDKSRVAVPEIIRFTGRFKQRMDQLSVYAGAQSNSFTASDPISASGLNFLSSSRNVSTTIRLWRHRPSAASINENEAWHIKLPGPGVRQLVFSYLHRHLLLVPLLLRQGEI